ncbi:metal-dependent hydrolase, partial [Salmonella enterica]|uniref:metal-dependent hydrolase n=1 Tax=Salmonella enterica TaxID=28901 RepID=UPI003EDC459D
FFIESVRHYQDRITDPELREAIRAFIGQEGHHAKEHKGLNEFLTRRGLPIDKIDRNVGIFMRWMRKNLSPERQL